MDSTRVLAECRQRLAILEEQQRDAFRTLEDSQKKAWAAMGRTLELAEVIRYLEGDTGGDGAAPASPMRQSDTTAPGAV